jgi:hypothetical protein
MEDQVEEVEPQDQEQRPGGSGTPGQGNNGGNGFVQPEYLMLVAVAVLVLWR